MFLGITLTSFGIALVLNSGLGCFVNTAVYKGLSLKLGVPLYVVNIAFELVMIAIATYYEEGLGWTTIINATYGAVMINVFHKLLPHAPILALIGILIMPIAWSTLEKASFGATGSNILMKALMNKTKKPMMIIRTFIDSTFLILALIFAKQYVTLFTILLTFICPLILTTEYKLIHYKPTDIHHDFIIKKKGRNL